MVAVIDEEVFQQLSDIRLGLKVRLTLNLSWKEKLFLLLFFVTSDIT